MRPTCIVADDHAVTREGLLAQLASTGEVDIVGQASTGQDALELIRRKRPDLALLDVRMPDMSGIDITSTITGERLPTRVVMFSAFESHGLAERALESGAWGYVTKSSPTSMVVQALRAAMAGRRFLDPSIAYHLLSPAGPKLSDREREILELMSQGMQNGPIAAKLGIAPETVKTHVSHIFGKLHVASRTEAVASALREGLID